MSAIKSSDRNKLDTLYHRLRNQIGDDFYKIIFNQDHIRIQLKGSGLNETLESESFDFTPHIASILEYMIDEGMKITPLPEVKVKKEMKRVDPKKTKRGTGVTYKAAWEANRGGVKGKYKTYAEFKSAAEAWNKKQDAKKATSSSKMVSKSERKKLLSKNLADKIPQGRKV